MSIYDYCFILCNMDTGGNRIGKAKMSFVKY